MKICLGLAAVLVLSGGAGAQPSGKQAPRFYYDLGAAELDVSAYPQTQQAGYKAFVKACSQCHTLARPINAPIVKEADWRRFVKRMHVRTASSAKAKISPEEAKAIISFLTYDSTVRKVRHKEAFDAETQKLKKLFEKARADWLRRQVEDDARKVKAYGDAAGTPKPQ